ncbi:fungal-specific transcription factor domain-containing protein [Xylariales sp. AK1849]|nr:fungal-specific transcription factor domain-containing protein [Xylariales sp. AK1849]
MSQVPRLSVKSSASNHTGQRARTGTRTHRGLTCQNCRVRKTRCDGTQPSCKTCEVYQDECRYEKPPPMSQIIGMAKRLQEAEATIAELKTALEGKNVTGYEKTSNPVPDTQSPIAASQPEVAGPRVPLPNALYASSLPDRTSPKGSTTEELLSDLSLDESGKICYYGPTSAVRDPPRPGGRSPNFRNYDEQTSKIDVRSLLTSNAMESRAWEEFAMGNAAVQNDIPRDIMSRLLKNHWVWIAPMFMWVYRPAFMRDMMTGGQYYSPLLLIVMCGHAARFHEKQIGEMLISRARLLLGTELHRPSSITTVQALLQLSARDIAYGQVSQAWTYSGIAFRMVSDLGLRHSSGSILSLGHLNAEDLEIRRRLFWSCYFWDKAMSLYLGRTPALIELPSARAPELLDDFAEHELWSPEDARPATSDGISAVTYPPMKSHVISCFENSCKLAIILSDIMLQLYSRNSVEDGSGCDLRGIRERIDEWRALTPDHLKLEPDNLPNASPPLHIVSQNLLYFTTIILLHRPFNSAPAHHAACRQASDSAEKVLLLLDSTFGFSKLSYLMAYCIYTSASVMVQDSKAGDALASRKTETFLRALKTAAKTCHLIQRSLDIITNGLNSEVTGIAAVNPNPASENLLNRHYLPAFPYRDHQTNLGGDAGLGGMDLDPSSFLECFPEQHMENTTGDWYLPP